MRAIARLFTRFNAPRASRWLIATCLVLLTAWLQAHMILAALHDDGTTVRSAIAVYNDDAVRGEVAGVVDWAFTQGATLTGAGAAGDEVRGAVVTALGSGRISAPVADALVGGLLGLRDDALAQFAQAGPTRPLTLQVGPLLAALGIPVTAEVATQLGLPASAELAMPIVDARTVDTLRTRYHWTELIDTWALLAAAVLGLAGVCLSPRPLRTLAITMGLGCVVCLLAIPLFGLIEGWLIGGGAGPWSPLVAPLVQSAIAELRPWLFPLGVAAVVLGVGGLVGWLVLDRRAARGDVPPHSAEVPDPSP
ncbi:hypothetical protein GCM10009777_24650 [Microbacterium pumilum]|uniref:ABC transporter permease n=2 Tax=Microbacterium pumilum TaxID=344165 RepID=A0ABP5E0H9_9MICO